MTLSSIDRDSSSSVAEPASQSSVAKIALPTLEDSVDIASGSTSTEKANPPGLSADAGALLSIPEAPTESPTEGSTVNEQLGFDEEKAKVNNHRLDTITTPVSAQQNEGQQQQLDTLLPAPVSVTQEQAMNESDDTMNTSDDQLEQSTGSSSQQEHTTSAIGPSEGSVIPDPLAPRQKRKRKKHHNSSTSKGVRFSHVRIREYNVTIGDNPCCSYGPPLTLDWEYAFDQEIPMDVFENHHVVPRQAMQRRAHRTLLLSATERRTRLWRAGHSLESIDAAAEELERYKWRESMIGNVEPLYKLQEVWQGYLKPIFYTRAKKERRLDQQLDRIQARVRAEHTSQASSVEFTVGTELRRGHANFDIFELEDEEDGNVESNGSGSGSGRDVEKATGKVQSIMIEGMATLVEEEKDFRRQAASRARPGARRGGKRDNSSSKAASNTSASNESFQGASVDAASSNSEDSLSDIGEVSISDASDSSYGIQVDNRQQDKATQIILKSFRRPHMRAFHASWFSFFVSFFSWFAITPLLSEVQDTLGLEKSDIWMSSLFGTLGTIVMRIIMGPLCDAFGARHCMAFILLAAAIPTALTGLIQSSFGLSLVRLFIGIGGSSFVACQYWTHEMFTREVAGTANALVAGWGNLGGGVTNLIMGSVLFPLFRWIFRDEDDGEDDDEDDTTSSELAWRTICIFPAILSLVTAFLILCYSDDSPKGSYKQRIRSENMMVTSPMESLRHALNNWNVWILTLQYACCFGVEVTMTNAAALYFKDEYGQSTVSAAGIASIFGFMNLFARALGGVGSDLFNARNGIRGRLFWQTLTLFIEGVAIGVFAYSHTLAGSICALVFLSIMVQSAEGSTFGIVPYVNRRFTGKFSLAWVYLLGLLHRSFS